jgi:hypothetical protein
MMCICGSTCVTWLSCWRMAWMPSQQSGQRCPLHDIRVNRTEACLGLQDRLGMCVLDLLAWLRCVCPSERTPKARFLTLPVLSTLPVLLLLPAG